MKVSFRRCGALIVCMLALAAASCGHDEGLTGTDAGDDSDGASPDSGDADLVTCPLTESLEFGGNGYVTDPVVVVARVTGCVTNVYKLTRWEQSRTSALFSVFCRSIPACHPGSPFAAVRDSLADPDVIAALAQTPPAVYGLDRRNVDKAMYVVRAGGDCMVRPGTGTKGFDLGPPCEEGTPDCHAIDPAIALFVERLQELQRQKRLEQGCLTAGSEL